MVCLQSYQITPSSRAAYCLTHLAFTLVQIEQCLTNLFQTYDYKLDLNPGAKSYKEGKEFIGNETEV